MKIYSLRNVASRYLRFLLDLNTAGETAYPQNSDHPDNLGWKHGEPIFQEGVVYIFVVRELVPWLVSVHNQPRAWAHHTKQQHPSFIDFVTTPRTNKAQGQKKYSWGDLFDCRYSKIKWYIDFAEAWGNSIFVSTRCVKNNPEISRDILRVAGKEVTQDFIDYNKHTDTGILGQRNSQGKHIPTTDELEVIAQKREDKIERWVEQLTVEYYVN